MSSVVLLVASLFASAAERVPPTVPAPSPPVAPVAWVGALADGVPVWLVERHTLPLVRVELSFDVTGLRAGLPPGALDALDATWSQGGTPAHPAAAWRAALERIGAAASVGCGPARCGVALEAPAEALAEALRHVGAIVRAPALPAAEVRAWRRDARREWRTDWLGPGIVHARALGRLTWPDGHPYREDRPADTFDVSVVDVRRAWRSIVANAPARLVVVGDIGPAAALPLLEAVFGDDALTALAPEGALAPPEPIEARRVFVDAPGANQALVTVAWASPPRADVDAPAYALAFHALAEGFASRLNLRLREGEGLTYRIDGANTAEAAFGRSTVELAVDPERLPAALASLEAELERAGAGFTEAEVEAGRRQAWAGAAVEMSTLGGVARALSLDGHRGRPPGDTVIHLARLRDVSVAEVDAAAARWLAGPRLWLLSGDGESLEPALDTAGWAVDTRWGACSAVYDGRCP